MTIEVYTFEDTDENEVGWSTQSFSEAQEYAKTYSYALIANHFVWEDDELIEDHRSGHALDGTLLEKAHEHPSGS